MKTYSPKALINGFKIGKHPGTQWVAVPDKFEHDEIVVEYDGKKMVIQNWKTAETYRTFPDKFGRDMSYTLGYFPWGPEEK